MCTEDYAIGRRLCLPSTLLVLLLCESCINKHKYKIAASSPRQHKWLLFNESFWHTALPANANEKIAALISTWENKSPSVLTSIPSKTRMYIDKQWLLLAQVLSSVADLLKFAASDRIPPRQLVILCVRGLRATVCVANWAPWPRSSSTRCYLFKVKLKQQESFKQVPLRLRKIHIGAH